MNTYRTIQDQESAIKSPDNMDSLMHLKFNPCPQTTVPKKIIWFQTSPHGNRKVYIVSNVTIRMVKRIKRIEPREDLEAYLKILYWFFSFPNKEMSLNDLSQELRISKTTANRIVTQFASEGFLKKEVLGRIWRISCNQSHYYFHTRKISHNLTMVCESGILEEIHKLIPGARATILFGSYRKGDDTEKSDIDIAVEVLDNDEVRIVELGIISLLGYRKNVPVNLHIFSRNKIDMNLFANIANGIVLEGFLEVRP